MASIDPGLIGIIGGVAAIVSGGAGWLTAKAAANKGAAETDSVIVASAERVVSLVNAQLVQVRRDAADTEERCERQIAALHARVEHLERALRDAGVEIPRN